MTGVRRWLRGLLARDQPISSSETAYGRKPDEPLVLTEDINDFALAMFHRLRGQPGNLVLSPLSIRTALRMAGAGARGETAAQMQAVTGVLSERIVDDGSGCRDLMTVANALWSQTGAPLQPEFVDVIARQFHGSLHLVDFRGDAESARIKINAWVEENTQQNIRELIARDELHEDTRLVLTNAVYFKGMWELPFYKEATRDEPFYLDSSATVTVPLMHHRRDIRYLESRGYQAIDLPYRGGTLSMLVLLPNKKSGLAALEQTLSSQMLHECVDRMYFREVDVSLPRFRVTWGRTNLRKELEALGMTLAFNPIRADFSGINGRSPADDDALVISAVAHKAVVDTNEEGTEASAATLIGMRLGRAATPAKIVIPVFRADHPFLFAIRDRKSDGFLFLGRVADPTGRV
jgi:serpin B